MILGQIILKPQGDTFIGGTACQYMSRDGWAQLRADCESRLSKGYTVLALFEGRVIGQFFKAHEWHSITSVPLGLSRYVVLVCTPEHADDVCRDFLEESGNEFEVRTEVPS